MEKRGIYLSVLFIIVILGVSFVSAGWFHDITGRLTNQNINLSIEAGNQNPVISNVQFTTEPLSLTEGGNAWAVFTFDVFDNDLVEDINTINVQFTLTGPNGTSKTEITSAAACGKYSDDPDGKTAHMGCESIIFDYYNEPGIWALSLTIYDNSGGADTDDSATLTVNSLYSFYMATDGENPGDPAALTFPAISAGAVNQSSTNDPLTAYNYGNIIYSSIQVNATDLAGERNSSFSLYANNFSVAISNPSCGTDAMNNSAYTSITGATLTRGDYTTTANMPLYFCLDKAGSEIISQAYSTNKNGQWIVKVVE